MRAAIIAVAILVQGADPSVADTCDLFDVAADHHLRRSRWLRQP
jgi:hypothetical protein